MIDQDQWSEPNCLVSCDFIAGTHHYRFGPVMTKQYTNKYHAFITDSVSNIGTCDETSD